MADLISAMTAGFSTMATDALSGIGAVVPVVLPIAAAIIVVKIIMRVAKRASS